MLQSLQALVILIILTFVAVRFIRSRFDGQVYANTQSHLWIFVAILVIGFLIASYLLFTVALVIIVLIWGPKASRTRISLFLFLIPLIPTLGYLLKIGGLPGIFLTWPRLLTFLLLFPLLLEAFRNRPLLESSTDKWVLMFVFLLCVLGFRNDDLIGGIRAAFYTCVDILVPYMVISRSIKSAQDLIVPLFALLSGLFAAALINVAESALGWHMYNPMIINLTGSVTARYEYRVGILRAFGGLDRPSQSAFAIALGLGLLWALSPALKANRYISLAMCGTFALALLLTFARASWVSGLTILLFFLIYGDSRGGRRFTMLLATTGLLVVASTDFGERILQLLPFIGDQEHEAAGPVDYRLELLDVALEVSLDNPIFGNPDFGQDPRLDALRQPSGLLDIVNHYLLLVLRTGYLSLAFFVMAFATVILNIRKSVKVRDLKTLALVDHVGFVVSLTICALLLAIAGTSALDKNGTFLWSLAGIGVGYLNFKRIG